MTNKDKYNESTENLPMVQLTPGRATEDSDTDYEDAINSVSTLTR